MSKKKSISFYGDKKLYKQSLSVKGEKYPLERKKIKNTSYYYYILCRRHLSFFANSNGEMEGKKKNLLGSGKLQSKVTDSNISEKQKSTLTNSDLSYLNKTSHEQFYNAERSNIKGVGITNFTRFLKESKKQKKEMGGASKQQLNAQKQPGTGLDIFDKSFGFTHKTYVKPGKGINSGELNIGEFFPYRKSFICYWLLPFVGFVSSATMSLNKHNRKESDFYLSESFKNSDSNLLLKSNSRNNFVQNSDTNDFASDGLNPLIKKSIPDRGGDKVSSKKLNKNNLNMAGWVSPPTSNLDEKSKKFSSINSLKFCMLYLDCLENDLKFLEEGNQNTNELTRSETKYKDFIPPQNNYLIDVLTNNFNKINLENFLWKFSSENGMDTKPYVFYPTSFFNRALQSNESFDRFFNEPLKIHLNVPLSNVLEESDKNDKTDIVHSVRKFKQFSNEIKDVFHENIFDEKTFFPNLKFEKGEFQVGLPNNTIKLNINNPVTSFLRASTLLDKYMVYKPILQDFSQKSDLKINIKPELVDKLFSYFSKESGKLPSQNWVKPLKDPNNKNLNSKTDLSLGEWGKDNLNKTESSGLRTTIIFQKLGSLDNKNDKILSTLAPPSRENFPSGKFSSVPKGSTRQASLVASGPAAVRAAATENKIPKKENLIDVKVDSNSNNKIFNKISKEKLYKVVLSTLKETLNNSKTSPEWDQISSSDLYFENNLNSHNQKTKNKISTDSLNKSQIPDTIRIIKFKHPILMANKSSYPLLYSKNKMRENTFGNLSKSLTRNAELDNLSPFGKFFPQNLQIKNYSVNLKKNYPLMLQNVSPVLKEKRPLEKLNLKVNPIHNDFLKTGSIVGGFSNDKLKTTGKKENFPLREKFSPLRFFPKGEKIIEDNFFPANTMQNSGEKSFPVNEKNKQKSFPNQYYQFKTYLNKYTGYALKDFLILNKIATYIKPISQDYSIKKPTYSLKTDIFPLDSDFSSKNDKILSEGKNYLEGFANKNVPRKSANQILYGKSKILAGCPHGLPSAKRPLGKKPMVFFLHVKNPYVLNSETKENLIQKHSGENSHRILSNFPLDSPNENFTLTTESPLMNRKIRQNNKTAKLLRAYFSLKKSSQNKVYGVKNNLPTSSNRLKQKIYFHLNSKAYFPQISFVKLSDVKQTENSGEKIIEDNFFALRKKPKVFSGNKTEPGKIPEGNFSNIIKSLKEKNQFRFLSTQFHFQKIKQGLRESPNNLQNLELRVSSKHEGKEFSLSPRLLINNRLFMKINNKNKLKSGPRGEAAGNTSILPNLEGEFKEISEGNYLNSKEFSSLNEEIIRKRKSIQKKRRITKMKKETRRRKKRMRFYPRPIWLRYRFYSQFLKNRRNIQKFQNGLYPDHKITFKNLNSTLPQRSHYTLFPYTTGHSNINISSSLMGEFKTAFWKSYWLRSNLKPYLNKIKKSLNDIKKTPQYTTNINSSMVHQNGVETKNVEGFEAKSKDFLPTQSHLLNNVRNFIVSFLGQNKNLTNVTMNSGKIFEENSSFNSRWRTQGSPSDIPTSKDLSTPLHSLSKNDIESYYKTANNLAEYNEISSQRIQQFVSQIRENLTLNGNAKARPSRISMNFGPKGLKKNGINFLKRPTLRYNAMSRLRLYWAFSKGTTNLAGLGPTGFIPGAETVNGNIYNKRKQIWTTEKYRQQIKENKTKRLLNDIKTKLQLLLNETPYISSESNIPLWNTLILKSVKKIKLQEEKFQNIVGNNQRLFPKDKISRFDISLVGKKSSMLRSSQNSKLKRNRGENSFGIFSLGKNSKEFFPTRFLFNSTKKFNSFGNNKTKSSSKRQFNLHKNRLINSYKRTAKVQPFISGKTNYWWTYGNNTPVNGMNSFLSTPVNTEKNLMSVSPSQHQSALGREQVYGTLRQDTIFNSQIKQGWARPSFKSTPDNLGMEWHLSTLQINTILFHFCSLITLLSISQIRGLLKFSFIGFNKVYALLERLIPSDLYNSPIQSYNRPIDKSNFGYNLTNLNVLYSTNSKDSNKKDSGSNTFETTEQKNLSQREKMLNDKKNRKLFKGDPQITLKGSDQEFSFRKKTIGFFPKGLFAEGKKPAKVYQNSSNGWKNFQGNFFIFDFEKQNDSFIYAFYVNRQKKDIPSNSFNPRISLETQSKVIRDSHNLFIRPNVDSLDISNGYLKSSSLNKFQNVGTLFTFFSITGMYYLLNNLVKKPIFLYHKLFNLHATGKSSHQVINSKGEENLPPDSITQMKKVSILYSLIFLRFGFRSFTEISKNTSNLLGQRTKLEGAFRSIYTFFEKPGVLIVDWVGYLFLVEWASDITNTLPEKVDTQIVGSPFNKLTRIIYNIYPFLPWTESVLNHVTFKGVVENNLSSEVASGLTSKMTFLGLASTFLKRRIYHLYEILLLQFYQPDTDLLVRQRKGIVFWDIWGDFLTQTAEDSNINISELTSLKEEQMKLLENASLNISESLSKKSPSSNLKRDNINDLFSRGFSTKNLTVSSKRAKQKIYSKIPAITPLKYLLSQKGETNNKSLSIGNFSGIHNSTLKPITSSLGMPFKPFLGVPFQLRSQNLDGGLHQWGSQQFLSYAIKSKDTELFIDLHPPRALSSVLKNKESSQQLRAISPMGSLVCQIFAGILYKQISKNVLIVGNVGRNSNGISSSGINSNEFIPSNQRKRKNDSSLNESSASLEKTLLVQAIAGETELKIITDNAHRYALVYRGVAVGIKLLRDVFDSLSLQTPCFFLIEDIHAIGERRPFLLSDDTPEGGQNSEIHEKNQVLYQLSKHVISHYKKPYKGDFSLSIPTNHFCFDFFKGRNQNNSQIGKASITRQNTVSPKIRHTETPDGEQKAPRILSSRLLRPSTELLSPPATSPFSVLTLKEEKKFKTHKKVSDLPWTGRIMNTAQGESSGSQDSQKTGPTYSVRAKVALLADIAISSLSVKLDMITDLLVIIDSVKGNRGFVVFATTHIPFVLDPALRRPGRLDETISFGFSSKSHSWEVSQFGILNVPRSSYTQPSKLLSSMSGFNTYTSLGRKGGSSLDFSLTSTGIDTNTILTRLCQKASQTYPFSTSSSKLYLKRTSSLFHFFPDNLFHPSSMTVLHGKNGMSTPSSPQTSINYDHFTHKSTLSYSQTTKILSQVAAKASAYLNSSLKGFDTEYRSSVKDHKNFDLSLNNALTQLPDLSLESILSNSSYLSLYASPYFFKKHISILISGKIGEFFLFSNKSSRKKTYGFFPKGLFAEGKKPALTSQRFVPDSVKTHSLSSIPSINSSKSNSSISYSNFVSNCNTVSTTRRSSLMPVITESISSLVLSFIQKRFLYKRNLMLPTLFNLTNYSSLLEPPSPPITSILLPARRYENLKRSLSYYQNHDQNFGSGIMEKINLHQQQRLVKRLYNIPVKESFKSEIIENRLSSFSNASLMIGSMSPSNLQKISSSNWFVRNRIFTRHSHYLTNQWWTGQLPEHNAETTFLSDIDWRYTFVEREARDILLDFPDADQHYNPRNRRWVGKTNFAFGTNGMPSLSLSDNSLYSEIYSHFIYDSFLKAFNIYEHNREVFDFYAFHVCKQGLHSHLHEFERLKLLQRFLQD